MSSNVVLGIDVGGTSIKGVLADRTGRVLHRDTRPTPTGTARAVGLITELSFDICQVATDHGTAPAGIGVVVPGEVDTANGVAIYAANLGWRDVPFRHLLQARTGIPTALGHDVAAAGAAELRYGGHKPSDTADAVVVQLGTGAAALIVSGGHTVRGARGLAGEFGHIPVYPGGDACPCGQRGCLERYASAAAIERRYAANSGSPQSAQNIVRLLDTDPIAKQVWGDAVHALALGIATLSMLLDPRLIVFTGGLSAAGPALVHPVHTALAQTVAWRNAPKVEASTLGAQVGVAGATMLGWRAAGLDIPGRWVG